MRSQLRPGTRILLGTVFACILAPRAQVLGFQIIWQNGGDDGGNILVSQLDPFFPFNAQVADDFLLPDGPCREPQWLVTGVRWNGVYFNNTGPTTDGDYDFNIIIYADNGAGTSPTGGPGDPTETAIYISTFPNSAVNETPTFVGFGLQRYSYSVELATPFLADANTQYWLSVQGIGTFPLLWGWAHSLQFQQFGGPVFGGPAFGLPFWTLAGTISSFNRGASFELIGSPVPDGDCNNNNVPDDIDIAEGTSQDCNNNGIPDKCEIESGSTAPGGPFFCESDCCDPDCNNNGIPDACDIASLASNDCNNNGIPDECDIDVNSAAPGGPFFCTTSCDPDCNDNGIPDACDIAAGSSTDCNGTSIPDECEPGGLQDCNSNNQTDICDIANGISADCNGDAVPDECQLAGADCNNNTIPDDCDVANIVTYDIRASDLLNVPLDCGNGPFTCPPLEPGFTWLDTPLGEVAAVQIEFNIGIESHAAGTIHETSLNGVPDATFPSTPEHPLCGPTPGNIVSLEANPENYVAGGQNTFSITNSTACLGFTTQSSWGDGIFARITVTYLVAIDCNANFVPDACDITSGTSMDVNANNIPDECELGANDCNGNGVLDTQDIADGTSQDCNLNGLPDECDLVGRVTYDIGLQDLINVFDDCGSGPFNDCASGQPGFSWLDLGLGDVTSVRIEFNIGIECHPVGTLHATSLNGQAEGEFTSTAESCACTPIAGVPVGIDADPANYNIGTQNTFLITNPTACLGFTSQAVWGDGVFARVTVEYVRDCNANGVPDECEPDGDGDGVINACDNCKRVPNPDQADADGDGIGDACPLIPIQDFHPAPPPGEQSR